MILVTFLKSLIQLWIYILLLKVISGKDTLTPQSSRKAMESELNKGNVLICSYLANISYFKKDKGPKFKQEFSRHQGIIIDHDRDYFYIQDSYKVNNSFIRKIHKKNLFHVFSDCKIYCPN